MSEKKTGGPAFPETCNGYIIPGMTMRDYFAGQALASGSPYNKHEVNNTAEWCYKMADAMIRAKETNHE